MKDHLFLGDHNLHAPIICNTNLPLVKNHLYCNTKAKMMLLRSRSLKVTVLIHSLDLYNDHMLTFVHKTMHTTA